MTAFIEALIALVGNHPHWALVAVGLTAFAEALALVGLLVPGRG